MVLFVCMFLLLRECFEESIQSKACAPPGFESKGASPKTAANLQHIISKSLKCVMMSKPQ
jgi:hypothetical protein